jgi:hypothetical protein
MKAIRFFGLLAAGALSITQTRGEQIFNFTGQYLLESGNLHNWSTNVTGAQRFSWFAVPGQNGAVQLTLQGGQTISSPAVAENSYFDFWTTVPARSLADNPPLRFQWIFDNMVREGQPASLDTAQFFYGSSFNNLTFVSLGDGRNANGIFNPGGSGLTLDPWATIIGWRLTSGHDVGADVVSIQAFVAPVPEPSLVALLGLACGAALIWRKKARG